MSDVESAAFGAVSVNEVSGNPKIACDVPEVRPSEPPGRGHRTRNARKHECGWDCRGDPDRYALLAPRNCCFIRSVVGLCELAGSITIKTSKMR